MPLFHFDLSNSSFFYIILLAPVWRNKSDTDWHFLPFQLCVLESGASYSIFTTFEREAKTSAPPDAPSYFSALSSGWRFSGQPPKEDTVPITPVVEDIFRAIPFSFVVSLKQHAHGIGFVSVRQCKLPIRQANLGMLHETWASS
jgi:hypothetical protein